MSSSLSSTFREIQILVEPDWPFEFVSDEFARLVDSPTPRLVPQYENILLQVDLEPLQLLSWFPWLSGVCKRLVEGVHGMEELASLCHITITRMAVSKLIAAVILPNLPCQLPYPPVRRKNDNSLSFPSLTDQQKVSSVDLVVRVLLVLLDNAHTRGAVLKHYGELLAALLFLNSAQSKTSRVPQSGQATEPSGSRIIQTSPLPSDKIGVTTIRSTDSQGMPPADTSRLLYKEAITSLVDQVHQSTVFTHLMILHSVKGDGGRTSRIVRKILDTKLQREGGVAALLSATILPDQVAPETYSLLSTQDTIKICNLLVENRSDSFLRAIVPQVLKLLKEKDKRGHQVCANFVAVLGEKESALCETLVMETLLGPLEIPSDESQIEEAVISLNAWVQAAPPDCLPLSRLLPLLCLLYTSIASTSVPFTSVLRDALLICFDRLAYPCPFIMSILFPPDPGVTYFLTSSCSVISIKSEKPFNLESVSKTVIDFTNENNLNKIKLDIYRTLLENVIAENTPLDIKLTISNLLTELSSDPFILGSLSNHPQLLIDFLINLFSKNSLDSELFCFGLILLTVLLDDEVFYKKSNWGIISKLETSLKHLSESSQYEIKKLSNDALYRLNSLGIIKLENSNLSSTHGNNDLIHPFATEKGGRMEQCEYDIAYRQATDALLPVRAHALRRLAKLLQARDKPTLNNRTTLLHLFKMNLDNEDSYLYLSAVEGLSCLAATFPDDIISTLCQEFVSREGKSDFRLKIGQVIMKAVEALGERGVEFKKEILGALLIGVRDQEPLVRASSLSNIGQVAKVISFQIHDYLEQVLDCVEFVLENEEELEVRRAAVLVVSLLLEGLGNRTFHVLEEVLPTLYRKLREVYQGDRDAIARLHAQVALEHLSVNLRSILCTEPDLYKRISALDIK